MFRREWICQEKYTHLNLAYYSKVNTGFLSFCAEANARWRTVMLMVNHDGPVCAIWTFANDQAVFCEIGAHPGD